MPDENDQVIRMRHDPDAKPRRAAVIRMRHDPNSQPRRAALQLRADPAALWNYGPYKKGNITVKMPEFCQQCHSSDVEFTTVKEDGQLKWLCPVCGMTFSN